jgi:hypothetical protein
VRVSSSCHKNYLVSDWRHLLPATWCILTRNQSLTDDSGWFYGVGGGIRTRNENLPLGTFEFRALINPRKLAGDNRVKISVAVNLKFRYNGSYVSKPDIVELNGDVTGDIY